MRAFVTGATGFIGGRLARALLERGWDVTALVRTPAKAEPLRAHGVVLAPGDVTDRASVEAAIAGHDAVFHFAAWYAIGVRDRALMERINVGGTEIVLRAAAGAGIPRIVYCSSVAALGNDPAGKIGDETKAHHGRFSSVYEETKFRAHELARSLVADGMPVTMVMPGAVYGPGDESLMALMLKAYARRLLVACPFLSEGASWVHVDDVAEGTILSYEKGEAGQEYILGGDNETIGGLLRRAAAVTGIRAPFFEMPAWVLRASKPLGPLVGRVLKQPPNLIGEGLTSLSGSWMFSSKKAEGALGYRYRTIEEGIPETVAWIKRSPPRTSKQG